MDKTMGLIISATVVMVAGVIVLTIGSGSLGDFKQDSTNIGNQGCDYQQQKALENPDKYGDQLSSECQNEDFQHKQQEKQVVGSAISQLED